MLCYTNDVPSGSSHMTPEEEGPRARDELGSHHWYRSGKRVNGARPLAE